MKTPYDPIAKYLRHTATPEEVREVETWLAASPQHQTILNQLEEEWTHLADPRPEAIPDKEKVWRQISGCILPIVSPRLYTRRTLIAIASIAAGVALLIGVGSQFLIRLMTMPAPRIEQLAEVRSPLGQKSQVILPDGTSVWLNGGSSLRYAAGFNTDNREVEVTGEAFFEVAHDTDKRFVVHAAGADVVVHGTSFNVAAYADEHQVRVSLLEGSVSLHSGLSGEEIGRLSPNQMAIVMADGRCRIINDDAAITSLWTQNILRIYNEDISLVSKKLERWYGVHVHLHRTDLKHRYSFVVKTESLRELLELLNKVTPLEYTIEGEEVHIR